MQFTPEKLILNISNTQAVRITLYYPITGFTASLDTSNWQSHLHFCGDNQSRPPPPRSLCPLLHNSLSMSAIHRGSSVGKYADNNIINDWVPKTDQGQINSCESHFVHPSDFTFDK